MGTSTMTISLLQGEVRQQRTFPRKDTILSKMEDKLMLLLIYLKANIVLELYAHVLIPELSVSLYT